MSYMGGSLRYYKRPSKLQILRRPAVFAGAGIAGLLPNSLALLKASPVSATVDPSTVITFTGHGWGHGRGAGQYGQLGYAVIGGYNTNQILEHYYSNTTIGSAPNSPIRVVISANSGNDIVATSQAPFTVAGTSVPANTEVRMHRNADGTWEIDQSSNTTGCATNPTWSPIGTVSEAQAIIAPSTTNYATETTSNALALCEGGTGVLYRGTLSAADYQGSPRTVNTLDVEDYLRGVVASESPAYWATLGATVTTAAGTFQTGLYALEAQAVEARSYALSSPNQFGYADICDSPYCQVYGGMAAENTYSDKAIAATAGEVLLLNGQIARTEFSSSTGGYTAGGTFPAVVDQYDSICIPGACNTNHTWQTSVTVSQIESAFPQVGTLSSITVTSRDGNGDYGGRVTDITLGGSGGSVSVTGSTFAANLGLNSNFFTFSGGAGLALSPNAVATASNNVGLNVATSDGAIITVGSGVSYGSMQGHYLAKPIVGVAPTPDDKGYWLVASDGGIFSFGDAQFYGSTGAMKLNKPIVGMAATPDGKGYWLVASDGGIFSFGDAQFYGSTGAMKLNKPIVGMASSPTGKGYWLVASDGGIFTFGDATYQGSMPASGYSGNAISMAALPNGGYFILTSDGHLYSFGGAPTLINSTATIAPAQQASAVGVAVF